MLLLCGLCSLRRWKCFFLQEQREEGLALWKASNAFHDGQDEVVSWLEFAMNFNFRWLRMHKNNMFFI